MILFQRLLLPATLAALTFVSGCNRHDDEPRAIDPAALARANAQASQQDEMIRSQVSEGSVLADGVKTAMAEFNANRGYFPPDNESAGLAAAASISGKYVSSVDLGAKPGTITVTYSNSAPHKANPSLAGKTLLFEPQTRPSSIEWHCKSPNLKQKWCASSCECKG
jgi:type IV pilus assembly protein PilA